MKEQFSTDFFLQQENFRNWVDGSNTDDCAFWDKWLSENKDIAPMAFLAAKLYAGFSNASETITDEHIRLEWQKISDRIHASENKPSKSRVISFLLRAAAVVAFASLAGTLIAYYLLTPVITEYATNGKSQKKVVLSDGTEIALNNNSFLKTKSAWRFAPPREVWLNGEAYFSVKSHPESAELANFIVHTTDLDVKVLGTQFNVNSHNNKTKVLLDEGKVQLTLNQPIAKNQITMAPGDFVGYTVAENKIETTKAPESCNYITAWKTGFYEFNKTPVSEVIKMAEASLGVVVVIDKPAILKQTITGKIPSKNPEELFNSLASLFNLKFSKKDNTILLEASGKVK